MTEYFYKLTDLSVIKENRGMVHGARHNLTFTLQFQYTSIAHKMQKTHNKTDFLCNKYFVSNNDFPLKTKYGGHSVFFSLRF